MNAQRYCFFMKKHSQIVQFDSQIVQKCIFSSQLVPIGQKKCLLEIVMAVLERCLAGNLLEDAVESLVGSETA